MLILLCKITTVYPLLLRSCLTASGSLAYSPDWSPHSLSDSKSFSCRPFPAHFLSPCQRVSSLPTCKPTCTHVLHLRSRLPTLSWSPFPSLYLHLSRHITASILSSGQLFWYFSISICINIVHVDQHVSPICILCIMCHYLVLLSFFLSDR